MAVVSDQPTGREADYFVTGTDTGVGKTLVAAALLHALGAAGYATVGMKPVAAGAYWHNGEWRNEDVDLLAGASRIPASASLCNPYLFKEPVAPHLAAKKEGRPILAEPIIDSYRQLAAQAEAVVVEGVGGFIVPLGEGFTTADLARQFQLPVVLIVGLRLGCINHALTTALAIRQEGLILAGWVANTVDAGMLALQENIATLCEWLPAPYLGHIPRVSGITPEQAAKYIDWQMLLEGNQNPRMNSGA